MTPTISAAKKTANKTGRQTNNSLSSITGGNIYIESTAAALKNAEKKRRADAAEKAAKAAKAEKAEKAEKGEKNEKGPTKSNARGGKATASTSNSKKAVKAGDQKKKDEKKKDEKKKDEKKKEETKKVEKKEKEKEDKKEKEKPAAVAVEEAVSAVPAAAPLVEEIVASALFTETEEVLQIGMHKVLEHVKNHKDAWPFMDPVEEDIAPRYYSIIRRPMDLLQMEERLDNGQYITFTDFRNDFKLIVNNCRLYNGQNNEYTEMVNNLQQAFEKATRKYFEQNSSDEEVDLEYPDLKTNVFREKNQNAKNITPKIKEIIGSKAMATKLSSSGKKLIDKVVAVVTASKPDKSSKPKESGDNEKAIEKRGRKRKQKFKDKHKGKASKSGKRNNDDGDDGDDDEDDFDDESEEGDVSDGAANEEELDEPVPAKKLKKEKSEKPVKLAKKAAITKSTGKTVEPPPPIKKKKKNARKENIRVSNDEDMRSESEAEPEPTPPPKSNKNKKSKHVTPAEEEVAATGAAKHGQSNTKKDSGAKKSKVNKKRQVSPEPDKIGASDVDSDEDVPVKPKTAKERKVEKHVKANKKKGAATVAADVPEKKSKAAEKKKGKAKQKAVAVRSRSPSVASSASSASLPTNKFTVDLHEKYSKSASHQNLDGDVPDDEDEGADTPQPKTSKSSYKKPNDLTPPEKTATARNRSPSPSVSQYSSEFSSRSGTPNTKIKDKFDLIKERRSRSNATVSSNNDDNKWNQIVKNAAKIKDKTKPDGKVQEKNQKLKDTIEKLKQKNKQSKKLLNKLFDAKASANEEGATERDEAAATSSAASKNAFDLLRTESAAASSGTKKASPEKGKTKSKAAPVADAEAVDQTAGASKKSSKKHKEKVNPATKLAKKSAKLLAKATGAGTTTAKKANNNNNNNKANMEALELETEQTLKDINRWLEHTPRFPDFNSASNSPTRFNNLLDDFDTVTSKLDPADFGRPVPPLTTEVATVSASDTKAETSSKVTAKPGTDDVKEPTVKATPKQTIQLTGIPPPPGPHKRDKEPKKKSLKEKISAMVPKHVHRTIERLQPGKTKGNLIGTIHSSGTASSASGVTKASEESAAGSSSSALNVNKSKEAKNSLEQSAKDSGPKLSLGSVLNTAGFGLGQQHNFSDNENTKDDDQLCENSKDACSDDMELEEIVTSTELLTKEKERKEKAEQDKLTVEKVDAAAPSAATPKSELSPVDKSAADKSVTPNLNAWLKAFGVPKKPKKQDEEEAPAAPPSKKDEKSSNDSSASATATSPLVTNVVEQSFASPAPRTTRKASTGSTISERSSFSQDPDSPRIGIDERIGSYPAPYPSPLGASPIMTSPKEDIIATKPASPFQMNGAIRVGFYQDTTTKSSPEKSCSPRDQSSASPYSNYAQHLYVSTTTASASSTAYSNLSYTSASKPTTQLPTASLGFNNKNKTPSYFDQYKQPKSQESDYNSSISSQYKQPKSQESDYNSSIGSNPNSPYQSSQHSPYQQSSTAVPATLSPVAQQPAPVSPYQNQQPQMQPQATQLQSPSQQSVSPYQQAADQTINDQANKQSLAQQIPQQVPTPSTTNFNTNAVQQAAAHSAWPPNYHHSEQQQPHVNQQITNLSSTDSQQAQESQQQQQQQQADLHSYMGYGASSYVNNHHHSHYGHNMMDTTSGMSPMLMPTMANKMTPVPGKHDSIPSADGQSELLNLDCTKHNAMNASNKLTATTSKMHDPTAHARDYAKDLNPNKAHSGAATGYDYNMFDPFSKNMAYNNMSTSKALEMFNRAATMSFSKSFPNPLTSSSSGKNDPSADLNNAQMWNQQQQQQQQQLHNQHPQQQQAHQNYSSHPKPAELNVPNLHQPRYDMSNYKPNAAFNDASANAVDHSGGLRNIGMPMMDDNGMNGGAGCYYQKDLSAQNVYGKNVLPTQPSAVSSLQQMLKTPTSAYNASGRDRQAPLMNYNQRPPESQHPNVPLQNQQHAHVAPAPPASVETKPKRTRKKKNAAAAEPIPPPVQPQQPTSMQGFQSYVDLKPNNSTASKVVPPSESPAISLKTSSSIVPGSAFNFGPTSTAGLGLGTGIYGENTPYLEDYRNAANPYAYLPQAHRNPSDPNNDPSVSASAAASASAASLPVAPTAAPTSTYHHQFLPHPSSRGTYPFMNPPLEPNSQFYQQYLRNEEYRQARMMLNQGILGHGHSTPSAYPQPGYHPALGMHKPYDAMNRPPWFP